MKRLLLSVLLALFTPLPAVAEDGSGLVPAASVPLTHVEAFLRGHGGLLVKDFYDVGSVSGDGRVDVYAVVFSAPGDERVQMRGVRVEVTGPGKPAASASRYVDGDELEALSRGLKYMAGTAGHWKGREKQEYTEIDFSTKDRLRIGFYQKGKSQGAFASAGEIQAFFDPKELARLKAIVDDSLKMLTGK